MHAHCFFLIQGHCSFSSHLVLPWTLSVQCKSEPLCYTAYWCDSSLPPPSQGPYQVVTKDFEDSNPNCSANIRNSWAALEKIADESEEW